MVELTIGELSIHKGWQKKNSAHSQHVSKVFLPIESALPRCCALCSSCGSMAAECAPSGAPEAAAASPRECWKWCGMHLWSWCSVWQKRQTHTRHMHYRQSRRGYDGWEIELSYLVNCWRSSLAGIVCKTVLWGKTIIWWCTLDFHEFQARV